MAFQKPKTRGFGLLLLLAKQNHVELHRMILWQGSSGFADIIIFQKMKMTVEIQPIISQEVHHSIYLSVCLRILGRCVDNSVIGAVAIFDDFNFYQKVDTQLLLSSPNHNEYNERSQQNHCSSIMGLFLVVFFCIFIIQ